jgi:hypothetical protein
LSSLPTSCWPLSPGLCTCLVFQFLLCWHLNYLVALLITRPVFSFLSCSTLSDQFASVVHFVLTGMSHIKVVPLTFMTLQVYVHITCQLLVPPYVYISSSVCNQLPYCVLVLSDGASIVRAATICFMCSAFSTFCIYCHLVACSVPMVITYRMLSAQSWAAIINLSISPFGPELHNHTRDFSISADSLSLSQ